MSERFSTPQRPRVPVLPDVARSRLVEFVWGALRGGIEGTSLPESDVAELNVRRGVFVTLWLDGSLRGCVGSAAPRWSLARAVVEYARAAATRDPRFTAVTPDEIERLDVEISVLGPLLRLEGEPAAIAAAVRVGEDGVYVTCGDHTGLLLPQVATRFDWDAEQFLDEVCGKAGLRPRSWPDPRVNVHVFCTLSFPAPRVPRERPT